MALAFARLADPEAMPEGKPEAKPEGKREATPGSKREAMPGSKREAMPGGRREATRRLRDAMLEHPYLVAGRNRICTALMQKAPGKVVAKSGADGIYCVGVLPGVVSEDLPAGRPAGWPADLPTDLAEDRPAAALGVSGHPPGIGIAVKIDDGSDRARHPVVMETLRQLGVLTSAELEALAWYHRTPIKNFRRETVGELRPAFRLRKH
jgi:hypothetical protein